MAEHIQNLEIIILNELLSGLATPAPKPPNTKNDHLPPILLLYWYLYTGSEYGPKYFPKRYTEKKNWTSDKATCVPKLVKDLKNAQLMVEAIKHVKAGHHRMEPGVFALAQGIASTEKVSTANPIRTLLYNTASTILTTSDEILFFVCCLAQLKTGVGNGWKNCLINWYKKMPVEKLAIEVSRAKSRYGWKHKDILKLLHFKEEEKNKSLAVIFYYIWHGIKLTLEKYSSLPECENILMHLRVSEELRHTEDGVTAANLLAEHQFLGLDNVPVHLISSPEVWDVLILKMSPTDIAHNVERLYLSLLVVNLNDTTVPKDLLPRTVTQRLTETLNNSTTSPLLAYRTLMNYSAEGKCRTHVKQAYLKLRRVEKLSVLSEIGSGPSEKDSRLAKVWKYHRHKGNVTPADLGLIKTLQNFVDRSITKGFESQNKIDAHFLVALDLSDVMFKGHQQCRVDRLANVKGSAKTIREKHSAAECFYNKNLVPGHVALLLAQELSCRVKDVTVVIMTANGLQELELKKNGILLTFTELLAKVEEYMSLSVKLPLSAPILDAKEKEKKYDLFVAVIYSICRQRFKGKPETSPVQPANALKAYHQTVGSRDAGLVTVSLGGHRGATRQLEDGRRILDIVGVDEHIVDLITMFATTAKDKI